MYSIPCECWVVWTGQTGCSLESTAKDDQHYIQFYHLDKSTVAEHSINLGHCILQNDNSILAKKSTHMDSIIRKATQINRNSNNMNWEKGFSQNKSHHERTKKGYIQEHDMHSLLIWPLLGGRLKGMKFPPISTDTLLLSRPWNGQLFLHFLATQPSALVAWIWSFLTSTGPDSAPFPHLLLWLWLAKYLSLMLYLILLTHSVLNPPQLRPENVPPKQQYITKHYTEQQSERPLS